MSQRRPPVKPKEVIRALERVGFFVHHTTGSHIFKHPNRPGVRVTVRFHNKALKRNTLASIIEQAGYSPEEFIELL